MRVPSIMIAALTLVVTLAAGATPALAKKKKKAVKKATAAAKVVSPNPKAGTTGILTGEAAYKNSKHAVTFKSTHIVADRKIPMGTILTASNSPKDHDFVRLRFRWHPEMLASTDNLDNESEHQDAAKLAAVGGEAPLGKSVETAERKALSEAHAAAVEAQENAALTAEPALTDAPDASDASGGP